MLITWTIQGGRKYPQMSALVGPGTGWRDPSVGAQTIVPPTIPFVNQSTLWMRRLELHMIREF